VDRLLAPDRPDWRWARVAELSQYSTTAALARLQQEDEVTRRAFEFRRALDRGLMPGEFKKHEAAYELFMNRPEMRLQLEGFLIAGEKDDPIAYDIYSTPEVVELYHDLFFWVRSGLDRPIWLNSAVFGGLPHTNTHLGDTRGTALRMAYKLGPVAFREMLGAGLSSETTVQQMKSMVHEVLMTQVAMMSFSAGTHRELPEWVGRLMDQKDSGASSGNNDMDRAIDVFFEDLSISVADPTDERNLNLPAREERAGSYEVITHD